MDETAAGLAIQSEQSVVSSVESQKIFPLLNPQDPISDIRRRMIVVGYNDTTQIRENFVACVAASSEEECLVNEVFYRPPASIMGYAVSA